MKYRLHNVAKTTDCFNDKYMPFYTEYEGREFEIATDEEAIYVANFYQERANKAAIAAGLDSDSEEYEKNAPSLPAALVRVERDEVGDEIEIPSWNW